MSIDATQIKELICAEVDTQLDTAALDETLPLTQQGIDSLDMYTIFLSVEEKLGVAIPDSEVENLKSINDIVRYLCSE